ncbi:MAG: chemotaxis protein CheW, partial [Gammaproteobacteria bacterium]|nr:chemotaxis protein CheW [Gammaproteobacteria bacterium]
NIWAKFPRAVRDLALACGKKVRIEMEGKETELDKSLIESIKDPLTHIVRNSVDHGLEAPEERLRVGKPEEGVLRLRAYHEGGLVNIEISDDGKGIDWERVRSKAIQKGLISPEQGERLSPKDITNLLFLPGLSTAEKVTNVSGRGVGMDVVKTNIEKVGGAIDIQSTQGKGTTISVKIPLTLAIIPALIVGTADECYAIPQASLVELVRFSGEEAASAVEHIHGTPVCRLRGNLLPLVFLAGELELEQPLDGWSAAGDDEDEAAVNVVVLQVADRTFGLVVDRVLETEEIVVKPLGEQLKDLPCFAGATIRGDGRVALILDILSLAQRAGVVSEVTERLLASSIEHARQVEGERRRLLVFRTPDDGRMAISLSAVSRLERFPRSQVERVGEYDVIQYREQILPLLDISAMLLERRKSRRTSGADTTPASISVVVYNDGARNIGLVVEEILDIVDEQINVETTGARAGVLGSAVVCGRVTELLDVQSIVKTVRFSFGDDGAPRAAAGG